MILAPSITQENNHGVIKHRSSPILEHPVQMTIHVRALRRHHVFRDEIAVAHHRLNRRLVRKETCIVLDPLPTQPQKRLRHLDPHLTRKARINLRTLAPQTRWRIRRPGELPAKKIIMIHSVCLMRQSQLGRIMPPADLAKLSRNPPLHLAAIDLGGLWFVLGEASPPD